MEVEADGGQDGVDTVARAVMQVIAAHAVLVFDVADYGFDRSSTLHLAFIEGVTQHAAPVIHISNLFS